MSQFRAKIGLVSHCGSDSEYQLVERTALDQITRNPHIQDCPNQPRVAMDGQAYQLGPLGMSLNSLNSFETIQPRHGNVGYGYIRFEFAN